MRVLVVDDSALYRKVLRSVLERIPGVEVIGASVNGRFALERIMADRPDLITLDLEMPELDGLGLLQELNGRGLQTPTIMVSALTTAGAKATSAALKLGAFDFVLKPTLSNLEANERQLAADLVPLVEACRQMLCNAARRTAPIAATAASDISARSAFQPAPPHIVARRPPQIIGIGISTGGPVALHNFLPRFPADFPCPIVIVQHMPPIFTKTLADELNRVCPLEVVEGVEGMTVMPGRVVIAPGGRQMRVERAEDKTIIRIADDPPERNCRPAVDYLFRSLAACFQSRAWGAILTGMGDDGTRGAQAMKQAGSVILAQDEQSCVVYGMPRAAAEAGVVDFVGTLDQLAERLNAAVCQGVTA